MTARILSGAVVASLLSTALGAQTVTPTDTDPPAGPQAIAGAASSARHCVSGDAANVHGIGWVAAGTSYTITFDSAIALTTGVANLSLNEDRASSGFGTPDLRFTTSFAGSLALHVGGRGQAGCYRYKVEIQPPAAAIASAPPPAALPAIAPVKPSATAFGTTAITGSASSAKHCVMGNAAKIHGIGRVEQGDSVRIAFASDFDAIAGVTLLNFSPERTTFIVDDDGGGDLQPLMNFTASQSGTLALHVGSFGGASGCYRYQVQIQGGTAPAPSPTPVPAPAPTPPPPTSPRPPTGGGSTTTFVSSTGITCVGRGNGPVQGTCSGQITIRVGQSLPVGTTVWVMVQAQNFLFGSRQTTTSPPGQLTITVQGQIQMFDFNDDIVCPGPVTTVGVMRDSRQGIVLGNLTGLRIPVTCRRG